MQETRVQSLSQEDLLEEGMVTYTSILAWRRGGAWWAVANRVAHSSTK